MKPKGKILSLLLVICLVAGLLPTTIFAADGDKTIMLGTSGISDPTPILNSEGTGTHYTPSDYVYFGVNGSDPIQWRVLDADADNSGKSNRMFLLSEYLLDDNVVFESAWNSDDKDGQKNPNEWQYSDAQAWCKSFASNPSNFSEAEQSAMLGVIKMDEAENDLYDYDWGESKLTEEDKMFFLSARELADYVGNYNGAPGLVVGDSVWWLRSPDADYTTIAGVVIYSGSVFNDSVFNDWAARPAFNLDLDSVLFTSAAEGGKSTSGMNVGLAAVNDYDGKEWKLTLLDEARDFSISNVRIEEGKVDFSYSGAQTGTNEYISAVIKDNGAITHYGRILQLDGTDNGASGKASVTLPDGVTLSDTVKLYVFNEQYNGGENDDTKLTDYGSELIEVDTTYSTSANPSELNFGNITEGYTTAPVAKTVTITNTGNQNVTVSLPSSQNYNITAENDFTNGTTVLNPGGTAKFTVQPKTGLTAGNYEEKLTVTASGNDSVNTEVELIFTVNPKQYTLTIELNGGSGASAGGDYAEGTVIQINAGTRPNYRFTGWTSSDGGVFADASNASTTFTMPASDTTVTANWQYNGSSGGGGTTAPTYRDETLSAEGVTLSGSSVHKDAHLTVAEDALHDAESCGYCGQIRQWQAEGRVLAIYDVSLSRGFRGSVTLTFPVPESYNGRMLSVVHCLKDRMDTYEVTASDGIVRVTVDSLSPFVILCDPADPENPDKPATTELPFTDVASADWYYDAVAYAYENGLMTGISETLFDPDKTTTRGMIATILYRLEGEPEAPACDFTDVAAGKYYTDAIAWASENNLVNGYGDGTFGPDDNITREQMSALLYRYAEFKGYDLTARGDLSGYTDAAQISDYAVTAMQWAVAEDLVNGMGDGTLAPQGDSTRAQIATILMRFLENVAEK